MAGLQDLLGMLGLGGLGGSNNPTAFGGNPLEVLANLFTIIGGGEIFQSQMDWVNKAQGLQGASAQAGMNPADLMGRIRALEQPMGQNFTQAVMNPINAQLAARGMTTSPGQTSMALEQGLAPYQLQIQQMAQQESDFGLGLPMQLPWQYPTLNTFGSSSNSNFGATPGIGGSGAGGAADPFAAWLQNAGLGGGQAGP